MPIQGLFSVHRRWVFAFKVSAKRNVVDSRKRDSDNVKGSIRRVTRAEPLIVIDQIRERNRRKRANPLYLFSQIIAENTSANLHLKKCITTTTSLKAIDNWKLTLVKFVQCRYQVKLDKNQVESIKSFTNCQTNTPNDG